MEDEIVTAAASEQIIVGVTGLGDQLSPLPVGDPAPGAKVISPERHAKIQAALKREARRIGYRFLLLHLKTECVLAFLRVHFAVLVVRAKLQRFLDKLVARVGHRIPLIGRIER